MVISFKSFVILILCMAFLDPFFAPIKYADEQVLKQYTKLGMKIPEERLYEIAFGLGLASSLGTAPFARFYLNFPPGLSGLISGIFLGGPDFFYNLEGLTGREKRNASGETTALNPIVEFVKSYNRKIRFPVFLAGAAFLGEAAYEAADYFMNGTPTSANFGKNIMTGAGFFSLASSMYFKDHDPKLLEKEPYWKKAYNWLKETAMIRPVPQPVPVPVPIPVRD